MGRKLKKKWEKFWEKEKFVVGILSGMMLTIAVLVISVFIALAHLAIVGC